MQTQTKSPSSTPCRREDVNRMILDLLHDFRNQLSCILLEATDLQERMAEKGMTDSTESIARMVRQGSDRLKEIRERLEPSKTNFHPIEVEAWLENLKAKSGASVAWNQTISPEMILSGDIQQLSRAVQELIQNGVEGAPRQTPVSVNIFKKGNFLIIEVQNATDSLNVKTEEWGTRLGFSTKRNHIGLGCAYVREIAHRHGGEGTWQMDSTAKMITAQLQLPIQS